MSAARLTVLPKENRLGVRTMGEAQLDLAARGGVEMATQIDEAVDDLVGGVRP